jgi:uncharacterized NAD(P)/FAD-binding protein YdhS
MIRERIGIIGGGVCGALVAIHLLRSGRPLAITLFERSCDVGRGVAYSAKGREILLNVPAARMSPLPDEPTLFFDWASAHANHPLLQEDAITPQSFLPRELYGEFICELLARATQESEHGSVEFVRADVQGAHRTHNSWAASGIFGVEEFDHLVLALGNPPPTLPPSLSQIPSQQIINPWQVLPTDPSPFGAAVLCVGSGLTAIDVVVKLHALGYGGKIHCISRHGLVPHTHHSDPLQVPDTKLTPPMGSLAGLVRALRQQIAAAAIRGEPWQIVLDTLRPSHQSLWQSLSLTEQQRFIRHLSPYWEIHRHRIAPTIHALIQRLIASGQLTIHAGSIANAASDASGVTITVRQRGGEHILKLTGSHLFLCTGPARTIHSWQSPLIEGLLADTFIEQDNLGIGFRPTASGESSQLYVLGTALRGTLWESTAIRELALQAKQVANRLLQL